MVPSGGSAAEGKAKRPRVAILVVNGFFRATPHADFYAEEARRFPWIDLCLRQIARFTSTPHTVHVWDNADLPEHNAILAAHPDVVVHRSRRGRALPHGQALDRLLRRVPNQVEYVVTMDTDAFPVRRGWLPNLLGRLQNGAALAGIWRDEMAPDIEPFVHPSCLAVRHDTLRALGVPFRKADGQDVAWNLTRAVADSGGRISRLRRSNVRSLHFLMGGLYADLVYHQGAGSRDARFWTSQGDQAEEATRVALRDAAFRDLDALVDYLSGDAPATVGATLGLPPPIG